MTLHFLNDVTKDAESMGKLINRIARFASFDIKFTRHGFENAC